MGRAARKRRRALPPLPTQKPLEVRLLSGQSKLAAGVDVAVAVADGDGLLPFADMKKGRRDFSPLPRRRAVRLEVKPESELRDSRIKRCYRLAKVRVVHVADRLPE